LRISQKHKQENLSTTSSRQKRV